MARQVNGHLGTFTSIDALTAKFPPAESIGCSANVGTAIPYTKAWCNGEEWALVQAPQIQALIEEGGASSGAYEVADWAALLALTGVPDGRVYTVLAPIVTGGTRGTQWAADSDSPSGWRPKGRQIIWHSTVQVDGASGGTTVEQVFASMLLPAGLLDGAREFTVRARFDFSGADAANRRARVRLGTAGTTSDGAIVDAVVFPSNVTIVGNIAATMARASATSLRIWGSSAPDVQSSSGGLTDKTAADLSQPLYLGVTLQQGASPSATASLAMAAIYVD